MNNQLDRFRISGFFVSVFILVVGFILLLGLTDGREVSPLVLGIGYISYLVVCGLLMTAVIHRLYRQHQVRKLRFDLLAMLLITALVATPLAWVNGLWELADFGSSEDMSGSKTIFLVVATALAVFLWISILNITEALLFWFRRFYAQPTKKDLVVDQLSISHADYLELIRQIRALPRRREIVCQQCQSSFSHLTMEIYAKCPKCQWKCKTRSFGAYNECQDVIGAVLAWLGEGPEFDELIKRRFDYFDLEMLED